MKKRALSVLLTALLVLAVLPSAAAAGSLSNFSTVNTYKDGQFHDVPSSAWYSVYVKTAYEYGLMNGKSAGIFEPDSNLTIAEAIKLAATLHSIYHTGSADFQQSSPWYKPYVDYAYRNGISSIVYTNYNATATRAEFASIFANALPAEALTAINEIDNNAIPDVPSGASYGPAVYRLYKAGILTGSDSKGTFFPDSTIRRSEVAAIAARMANSGFRQKLTLTVKELSATEIAAKCSPAVFYVEMYDYQGEMLGSGSGFFISSSGVAVTNNHVISEVYSAKITTYDGKKYDIAGVYDYSAENDLALIQVDGSGFPYLEVGASAGLQSGATIYAIGNPLGLAQTFTPGLITNAAYAVNNMNYIMFSAAISAGSSGGALLNTSGQVIGVTSASYDAGQNLNLAVPIHLINELSRENDVPLSSLTLLNGLVRVNLTSVSVAVGKQVTVTITDTTGNPDYIVACAADDEKIVYCKRGSWIDNYTCPLYITGLKAGSTVVYIGLFNEKDEMISYAAVYVTVTGS